ncbi:hypothetical protein U1Q18_036444 [Sarracenia purpurea var. burkii]
MARKILARKDLNAETQYREYTATNPGEHRTDPMLPTKQVDIWYQHSVEQVECTISPLARFLHLFLRKSQISGTLQIINTLRNREEEESTISLKSTAPFPWIIVFKPKLLFSSKLQDPQLRDYSYQGQLPPLIPQLHHQMRKIQTALYSSLNMQRFSTIHMYHNTMDSSQKEENPKNINTHPRMKSEALAMMVGCSEDFKCRAENKGRHVLFGASD